MDMAHLMLPWLLAYGHLVIIASAAIALGLTATRSNPTMTDADIRARRKQKQGGHIFNETLREMRARNNRMIDGAIRRLSKPDLSDGERTLCAEVMAMCRNEIEDIDHLLDMKEPD